MGILRASSSCVPSSQADAYAIRRNRANSFFEPRPQPSDVLLGIETADRRIWLEDRGNLAGI